MSKPALALSHSTITVPLKRAGSWGRRTIMRLVYGPTDVAPVKKYSCSVKPSGPRSTLDTFHGTFTSGASDTVTSGAGGGPGGGDGGTHAASTAARATVTPMSCQCFRTGFLMIHSSWARISVGNRLDSTDTRF